MCQRDDSILEVCGLMKKTTETERQTFRKALLILSFVQLVLAFALFIVTSMQLWFSAILGLLLAGIALLAVKLQRKRRAFRIITRSLYITIPALALALVLFQLIFQLVMNWDLLMYDTVLQQVLESSLLMLKTLFFDCAVFVLPGVVLCARAERPFDIVMTRIYSVVVFLVSLAVCFLHGYSAVVFSVDHILFRILFCVCTACTACFAFFAYPLKWWPFKKTFASLQAKRAALSPKKSEQSSVPEK